MEKLKRGLMFEVGNDRANDKRNDGNRWKENVEMKRKILMKKGMG